MGERKSVLNENEHMYEHYYKRSAAHRGFKENQTTNKDDEE